MTGKRGLVVLDFDDTLFFTHDSVKGATKELMSRTDLTKEQVRQMPKHIKGRIYELAYSKYKHRSKPNILLIKRLEGLRKSNRIIVLTARGHKLHDDTLSLIKGHSIKIDGFYSRKDVSGRDEVWKLQRMKQYAKKYKDISLYEDKIKNIEYIRANLGSKRTKFYLVTKSNIKKI